MCRKDACMHGSRPTSSECGSRDGNKLQPCASKTHFCSLEHVLGASRRRPQSSGGGLRKPPPLRSCRPPCPRSPGTVGAAVDGPHRARRLLQFLLLRRSSRTRASSVWEQLLASSRAERACAAGSCAPQLARGVWRTVQAVWRASVDAQHACSGSARMLSQSMSRTAYRVWCRAGVVRTCLAAAQHVY